MWSYMLSLYMLEICVSKMISRNHHRLISLSLQQSQVQKELKIEIQMKTCSLFPTMLQPFNDLKLLLTVWLSGIANESERERESEREPEREWEIQRGDEERESALHVSPSTGAFLYFLNTYSLSTLLSPASCLWVSEGDLSKSLWHRQPGKAVLSRDIST